MHIRWKNVYVYQLYRCLVMHTPGDSERHIFMVNDVNKRIYSLTCSGIGVYRVCLSTLSRLETRTKESNIFASEFPRVKGDK